MMNVLCAADFGAASAGNFIRFLKALENAVKSNGGRFVYLFPERAKEREWAKEMIAGGTPVYFFSGSFFSDCALMRTLIKKYSIKLVHSHFADRKIYLPLRFAMLGQKTVHIAHVHSELKKIHSKRREKVKIFLRNAAVNICVSAHLNESFTCAGYKNCVTVNNALDYERLDSFSPLDRSEFSIPQDKTAVMMFGYNFHIKGVDTTLSALDKYDKDKKYILLLCPAAHIKEAEESLIKIYGKTPDHVRLMPPREDIASYYMLADVFLSASRTEGSPYAVMEAAYLKKPLVLSDIPAHRELCIPNAVYFPQGSDLSLFDALEKASSEIGSEKLSENSGHITDNFSLEKQTRKILEIYKQALNRFAG